MSENKSQWYNAPSYKAKNEAKDRCLTLNRQLSEFKNFIKKTPDCTEANIEALVIIQELGIAQEVIKRVWEQLNQGLKD